MASLMPCSIGLMNSLRNRAALDLVDELVALARLVGLEAHLDVSVVARAAGLADVLAFRLGMLADGLAIRDLRLAHVGFHFVLAHHAVDDDFQVQLAHAADDGLPGIGVGMHLERGIFLGQPAQRDAHLFLVGSWSWAPRPPKLPARGTSIDSSTIGALSRRRWYRRWSCSSGRRRRRCRRRRSR